MKKKNKEEQRFFLYYYRFMSIHNEYETIVFLRPIRFYITDIVLYATVHLHSITITYRKYSYRINI